MSAARCRAVALALLTGAVLGSCLDFSTSPDEIMFLTFESLPYPSVVSGDTLRDSTGVATLLTATAVNARGDVAGNAPIRFYTIDDTADVVEVDSVTGRVVSAGTKLRNVRIIASLGNLQSTALPLVVTKQPDSLTLVVTSDTINYSFSDTTLNFSDPLTVSVLHHDSTTFYSGVGGWVVRFVLEQPSDTTHAALVDDQNRRLRNLASGLYHIDTTAGDGTAARRLRVAPGATITTPLNSVAVLAEAKYKGVNIAGSPVRVWVYLKPRV